MHNLSASLLFQDFQHGSTRQTPRAKLSSMAGLKTWHCMMLRCSRDMSHVHQSECPKQFKNSSVRNREWLLLGFSTHPIDPQKKRLHDTVQK
jgi:hypothetical protein